MSVRERVEYITYYGDRVVVEKSLRYYDESGELVSSGLIAEESEVPEGGKPEEAVEQARRKLREKLERERDRWREELKKRRKPEGGVEAERFVPGA